MDGSLCNFQCPGILHDDMKRQQTEKVTCNECLKTRKDVIAKRGAVINLIEAQIGQQPQHQGNPPIIASSLKSEEQVRLGDSLSLSPARAWAI